MESIPIEAALVEVTHVLTEHSLRDEINLEEFREDMFFRLPPFLFPLSLGKQDIYGVHRRPFKYVDTHPRMHAQAHTFSATVIHYYRRATTYVDSLVT